MSGEVIDGAEHFTDDDFFGARTASLVGAARADRAAKIFDDLLHRVDIPVQVFQETVHVADVSIDVTSVASALHGIDNVVQVVRQFVEILDVRSKVVQRGVPGVGEFIDVDDLAPDLREVRHQVIVGAGMAEMGSELGFEIVDDVFDAVREADQIGAGGSFCARSREARSDHRSGDCWYQGDFGFHGYLGCIISNYVLSVMTVACPSLFK